jgi:hypothetical protein
VLEKSFTGLPKGISFSADVLAWVSQALRDSHHDERKFHDEAIGRLQREHRRIQDRIDAMYMDKLDGRIDGDFFNRKAGEPELHRRRHPATGTGAAGSPVVRKSAARRKKKTPRFRTFGLPVEARPPGR